MGEFTDKDIGRDGHQLSKLNGRGNITAEDCPEIIRDDLEGVGVAGARGIRPGKGMIARLEMMIGKRPHGKSPITQRQGITIPPRKPCDRKPKSLLRKIEGTDPCTDRGNHFLRKGYLEGLLSIKEHCSLQQGRQATDMIDMPMRDKDSIKISNQGSPIAQGMDARLPRIDEQMLLLQQQKGTGKEAVGIGEAGTRS